MEIKFSEVKKTFINTFKIIVVCVVCSIISFYSGIERNIEHSGFLRGKQFVLDSLNGYNPQTFGKKIKKENKND